jgi:hypothetical protein
MYPLENGKFPDFSIPECTSPLLPSGSSKATLPLFSGNHCRSYHAGIISQLRSHNLDVGTSVGEGFAPGDSFGGVEQEIHRFDHTTPENDALRVLKVHD